MNYKTVIKDLFRICFTIETIKSKVATTTQLSSLLACRNEYGFWLATPTISKDVKCRQKPSFDRKSRQLISFAGF